MQSRKKYSLMSRYQIIVEEEIQRRLLQILLRIHQPTGECGALRAAKIPRQSDGGLEQKRVLELLNQQPNPKPASECPHQLH